MKANSAGDEDESDNISESDFVDTSAEKSVYVPLASLPTRVKVLTNLNGQSFTDVKFLTSGSNSLLLSSSYNSETVVIKMLSSKHSITSKAADELNFELGLLTRLSHPSIIRIIGAGQEPKRFIVVEYLTDGTLDKLLYPEEHNNQTEKSSSLSCLAVPKKKTLKIPQIVHISKEIISALKFLHEDFHDEAVVIHRGIVENDNDNRAHDVTVSVINYTDLKPPNIGFAHNMHLKILDFGLAACVQKNESRYDGYEMTGFTGTPAYMAPEVALCTPYNEKVDMYSFGVILWEMTSGERPFKGMQMTEFMDKVVKNNFRPPVRRDLPSQIKDIIDACWHPDSICRPSASEVLEILDSIPSPADGSGMEGGLKSLFGKFMDPISHSLSRVAAER